MGFPAASGFGHHVPFGKFYQSKCYGIPCRYLAGTSFDVHWCNHAGKARTSKRRDASGFVCSRHSGNVWCCNIVGADHPAVERRSGRYMDYIIHDDENFTGEYPAEAPFTIGELEEIYPTASSYAKMCIRDRF